MTVCLAITTTWASDLSLIDAVKRRDPKAFDKLLAQGVDINASSPDGATALAWASFLDFAGYAMAGRKAASLTPAQKSIRRVIMAKPH